MRLKAALFLILLPSFAAAQQRDIILILTDDQPYHTLGFMPAVDSLLVRQGVRFERYVVGNATCDPSRITLLTGLWSHNHGADGNYDAMRDWPDSSSLATWLQDAGYRTALIGKYVNPYAHYAPYIPPGWSVWNAFVRPAYRDFQLVERGAVVTYPPEEYSTSILTTKAVKFIRSTPRSKRIFLYFVPFAPHEPMTPATRDEGTLKGLAPYRSPNHNEADVSDKPWWIRRRPPLTNSEIYWIDTIYRRGAESLQAVDRAVGSIVQALRESGRLKNSVIIFASDNGYSLGNHRMIRKHCPYEECVREPLVIWMPGIRPRAELALVSNVDLAPTIAELAGVSAPGPVNGRSLVPLLTETQPWIRDALLVEQTEDAAREHKFHAVRTARYLYVEYFNGERELYDIEADPWQLENGAYKTENAPLMAQLSARLALLKKE